MKSFLFVLLILNSLAAFATTSKTCFSAASEVPFFLPSRICLDSMKITADQKLIVLVGDDESLPKKIKITDLNLQENAGIAFKAQDLLIYSGTRPCEEFYSADIKLIGSTDLNGNVDLDNLSVGIDYTYKVDLCHSSGESRSIRYLKE